MDFAQSVAGMYHLTHMVPGLWQLLAFAVFLALLTRLTPITRGAVPAHGFLFGAMLTGAIAIVTALTFFPTLWPAPIAEHYLMKSGVFFP